MWSDQLNGLLRSVQTECSERLDVLVRQIAEADGITEHLKAESQMKWVQRMNSIRSRTEEIVMSELTNR